jgi:hypothetical protein
MLNFQLPLMVISSRLWNNSSPEDP